MAGRPRKASKAPRITAMKNTPQKAYVFVYGSLMSLKSLRRTLPEKNFAGPATVYGYRRATSKLSGSNILFMNLVPSKGSSVKGKLVEVSGKELEEIRMREQGSLFVYKFLKFFGLQRGYKMVKIKDTRIIIFIAPSHRHFKDYGVLRSYLDTCLDGVKKKERKKWLAETELGGFIIEDAKAPRYGVEDTNKTKTKIV